ncbi:MAG: putative glyoxalase/bleomycin resistance protein/ dioxygenase [Candidatus Hydrogenedentota bacterium]
MVFRGKVGYGTIRRMSTHIVIHLPVSDLTRSMAFYEALGFVKDAGCSDGSACSLSWRHGIWIMLWTGEAYRRFVRGREVADTRKTNAAIFGLSLESREAVEAFAETAKAHGGNYYRVDTDAPEGAMAMYEVEDPDGHLWEPTWIERP